MICGQSLNQLSQAHARITFGPECKRIIQDHIIRQRLHLDDLGKGFDHVLSRMHISQNGRAVENLMRPKVKACIRRVVGRMMSQGLIMSIVEPDGSTRYEWRSNADNFLGLDAWHNDWSVETGELAAAEHSRQREPPNLPPNTPSERSQDPARSRGGGRGNNVVGRGCRAGQLGSNAVAGVGRDVNLSQTINIWSRGKNLGGGVSLKDVEDVEEGHDHLELDSDEDSDYDSDEHGFDVEMKDAPPLPPPPQPCMITTTLPPAALVHAPIKVRHHHYHSGPPVASNGQVPGYEAPLPAFIPSPPMRAPPATNKVFFRFDQPSPPLSQAPSSVLTYRPPSPPSSTSSSPPPSPPSTPCPPPRHPTSSTIHPSDSASFVGTKTRYDAHVFRRNIQAFSEQELLECIDSLADAIVGNVILGFEVEGSQQDKCLLEENDTQRAQRMDMLNIVAETIDEKMGLEFGDGVLAMPWWWVEHQTV